jgi:small subunit ribosomal protein S21
MARNVNVSVERKEGEHIEKLIRRFVKRVKKEGILEEYREKMYYEKPSDKKRRIKSAQKRAAQRNREEQEKMDLERKN